MIFALLPIGDIFLLTYAISKRIKLGMPETTQMTDLLKGFTGITNFNPFFLRHIALWFKRTVSKIRHFFCPQGYVTFPSSLITDTACNLSF